MPGHCKRQNSAKTKWVLHVLSLNILARLQENLWNGVQVIERAYVYDLDYFCQCLKGGISKSSKSELQLLCFANRIKYLNGFQLTKRTQGHSRNGYFQNLLCSKGRSFKSKLTRDMHFVFCYFSYGALHLREVSLKHLERFSTYRADKSTW